MSEPTFEDLVRLVRRLRGPDGCPWDRAQSRSSLLPYLVEEMYEVREAALADDGAALAHELGDLALHVAFQIAIAEERGEFDAGRVFGRTLEKMVRRHPHVFADPPAGRAAAGGDTPGAAAPIDAQDVLLHWEEIKRRERSASGERASVLDGVPRALPALIKAQRLQERAAAVRFDWPDARGPLEKVREELEELAPHVEAVAGSTSAPPREPPAELVEELGDLLFTVVNVARRAGVAAEDALERTCLKFRRRFARMERVAAERGIDIASAGLAALDGLWEEAKQKTG